MTIWPTEDQSQGGGWSNALQKIGIALMMTDPKYQQQAQQMLRDQQLKQAELDKERKARMQQQQIGSVIEQMQNKPAGFDQATGINWNQAREGIDTGSALAKISQITGDVTPYMNYMMQQNDPMRQLQIESAQLGLQNARNEANRGAALGKYLESLPAMAEGQGAVPTQAGIMGPQQPRPALSEKQITLDMARILQDPKLALSAFSTEGVTPYTDLAKATMDFKNGLITEDQYKKQTSGGMLKPEDAFKNENDLRDEYNTLSKDFFDVERSYNRVQASTSNPSPAGDLALIFNYMKMLDPGSTVREGEFANAQNSASVPEAIRAKYNQVISGERLSDQQRGDFADRADKLYDAAKKSQKPVYDRYKSMAERYGANPDNVVSTVSFEQKKPKPKIDPELLQYMTPEERALFGQ